MNIPLMLMATCDDWTADGVGLGVPYVNMQIKVIDLLFLSLVDRQPAHWHVCWCRHHGDSGGPVQPQFPEMWAQMMMW